MHILTRSPLYHIILIADPEQSRRFAFLGLSSSNTVCREHGSFWESCHWVYSKGPYFPSIDKYIYPQNWKRHAQSEIAKASERRCSVSIHTILLRTGTAQQPAVPVRKTATTMSSERRKQGIRIPPKFENNIEVTSAQSRMIFVKALSV